MSCWGVALLTLGVLLKCTVGGRDGALVTDISGVGVGDGKLIAIGTVDGVATSRAVIIARLCSETGGSIVGALWFGVVVLLLNVIASSS